MTLTENQAKPITITSLIGLLTAITSYYFFTDAGAYFSSYTTVLSLAWIAFAMWASMMLITLMIFTSHAKGILSTYGISSREVRVRIGICGISCVVAAVFLLLHHILEAPHFYFTLLCTFIVGKSIAHIFYIFIDLTKITSAIGDES